MVQQCGQMSGQHTTGLILLVSQMSAVMDHAIEFVNDVHTQNVESYWNQVEVKLKQIRGCHEH